MRELDIFEQQQVNGAFLGVLARFLVPVIANTLIYALNKNDKNDSITAEGLAIAAGTGIVTGGIGAGAAVATGGSLAATLAWTPTTSALNAAGNAIAKDR